MATSSFFYGGSSAPDQNTVDQLIDELNSKIAQATEAEVGAEQSAAIAQQAANQSINFANNLQVNAYALEGGEATASYNPQTLTMSFGIPAEIGPQGPAGPQGEQGLQGIQGEKGDKGDPGDTGPQGPQGIQGIKGDQGDQGIQGLKGDKGDTGDTGPQGLQGIQGIQGIKGDKGDKGDTGDTGPAGPAGADGADGADGATGAKGDKGLVWRDAYSSGTAYAVDEAVSYNGSSYICVATSTGNAPTNTTYWSLLAQKGADGTGGGGAGTGDVVGPTGAGDSGIALFDGTTGKLLKDSAKTVADFVQVATPNITNGLSISRAAVSSAQADLYRKAVSGGPSYYWALRSQPYGGGYGNSVSLETYDNRDLVMLQPAGGVITVNTTSIPIGFSNGIALGSGSGIAGPSGRWYIKDVAYGAGYGASVDVSSYDNRDYVLLQTGGGKVGVGNNAPTEALDVTGTVKATAFSGGNTSNWNTAYGWGNHASAGYLTSSTASSTYQPLDGDLTAIAGLSGTSGLLKKTAANTWTLDTNSYLTSYTETDPVFSASAAAGVTTTKIGNWDTAYSWGNHASAGYLTTTTAASTYLTQGNASSTYQPISGMSSYLTTASASSTYQTQAGMSSYLTTSTAASTYAPISTTVTLTGTQTLTNKTLTSPTVTGAVLNSGYTEGVYAVTGTTPALSPTNGSIQTWALSANSTPTAGTWAEGQSITLHVNDSASSYTVAWTSLPVTWVGGSAPTLAPAGGYSIISLWKIGTTIYGSLIGQVV